MKYFLIILCIFFLGCRSSGQKNNFPEKIAPDFSLAYHVDGGMRYYSEDLYISKDSCSYVINDGGRKTTKKFMLSTAEMDALYEMLQHNRFGEITYKTMEVYDRGGISIILNWEKNKKHFEVSDAQGYFIDAKWSKEWQSTCNYLTELIKGKAK